MHSYLVEFWAVCLQETKQNSKYKGKKIKSRSIIQMISLRPRYDIIHVNSLKMHRKLFSMRIANVT